MKFVDGLKPEPWYIKVFTVVAYVPIAIIFQIAAFFDWLFFRKKHKKSKELSRGE